MDVATLIKNEIADIEKGQKVAEKKEIPPFVVGAFKQALEQAKSAAKKKGKAAEWALAEAQFLHRKANKEQRQWMKILGKIQAKVK